MKIFYKLYHRIKQGWLNLLNKFRKKPYEVNSPETAVQVTSSHNPDNTPSVDAPEIVVPVTPGNSDSESTSSNDLKPSPRNEADGSTGELNLRLFSRYTAPNEEIKTLLSDIKARNYAAVEATLQKNPELLWVSIEGDEHATWRLPAITPYQKALLVCDPQMITLIQDKFRQYPNNSGGLIEGKRQLNVFQEATQYIPSSVPITVPTSGKTVLIL